MAKKKKDFKAGFDQNENIRLVDTNSERNSTEKYTHLMTANDGIPQELSSEQIRVLGMGFQERLNAQRCY